MKRPFLMTCLMLGLSIAAMADRSRPAPVKLALTASLRIEAPLDDGRKGYIQVFDRADGRMLWKLVVFENKIDPVWEEDVQWRFITRLEVVDGALEITAERGARYRVDLSTKRVESLPKKEENQPLQRNASTRSVSSFESPARRG